MPGREEQNDAMSRDRRPVRRMTPEPDLPDAGPVFDPARYGPVPVAHPEATTGEVRVGLVGRRFESAAHIAACRDGFLVGIARIEDILAADPATPMSELIDPDPPVIIHGIDQEIAAWKAVQHGVSALAVLDDNGRFVGLIPPRRIMEVLLEEHDEDLARLGGYLASTSSARHALKSQSPLGSGIDSRGYSSVLPARSSRRASWVYSSATSKNRCSFVPGIVYMADAVGTQTKALVIRGLSAGVPVRRIMQRELVTGGLVGVILAIAFFAVGLPRWGEVDVVLAVALALLAACSTATLVAMALPALLARFGQDPAFGSGPLATVIQDLVLRPDLVDALVEREPLPLTLRFDHAVVDGALAARFAAALRRLLETRSST
jgi:magnesium transporter